MRAVALVMCLVATAHVAHADPRADALRTKGEELARQGQYRDAIGAFKAANQYEPSAANTCSITLAYARLELWPQTEIWLDRCHAASQNGAAPAWLPQLEELFKLRIVGPTISPVTISVEPKSAQATVSVSDFELDESFAPRTIHLSKGRHAIAVSAPGYDPASSSIVIEDGSPRVVVIKLYEPGKDPAKQVRSEGKPLLIAGAITGGIAVASYGVMALSWYKLHHNIGFAGGYETAYDWTRVTSLSFFAVSAGLLAVGYYRHLHSPHPSDTQVGVAPLPEGGGLVTLGWQR
jgi:hypothetical protein